MSGKGIGVWGKKYFADDVSGHFSSRIYAKPILAFINQLH
jgi:hypothetical protein